MTTVDTEYAPTLFDDLDEAPEDAETVEEAFRRFRRRNPWFISRLATMAYEQRSRGYTRVSMKGLFELLRTQLSGEGKVYKLDNSWTSLAARTVMEHYPDLDGLFELRARRSER